MVLGFYWNDEKANIRGLASDHVLPGQDNGMPPRLIQAAVRVESCPGCRIIKHTMLLPVFNSLQLRFAVGYIIISCCLLFSIATRIFRPIIARYSGKGVH
ncbi:hypothetical protein GMOD_00003700 [Pyrenophora seminiperda CCB06]|uniref:Uncharacterized protein n=1 Tax=Pyrenophora seminiperda CCB06 TaxID=1302712 RepID=A0A3M7MJX4_9PLEO|nr:hypothetical protein GMOD_00003700 [Pyrenophora seminiperda CCB06]